MISTKELQKKAKEILESLDGMTVGEGISVMVYALSWLIESNVKKEERGECVENITEMLKTLLVMMLSMFARMPLLRKWKNTCINNSMKAIWNVAILKYLLRI